MAYSSGGHQGSRKRRARILNSPPASVPVAPAGLSTAHNFSSVILRLLWCTGVLVIFVFFRAFVGFLHDIAPGAQRFGDAG